MRDAWKKPDMSGAFFMLRVVDSQKTKKDITMSDKKQEKKEQEEIKETPQEQPQEATTVEAEEAQPLSEEEKLRQELGETKERLEKEKKEYMFLLAEFDNFRKRTLKEKSELIKNASENAMIDLLPVIDDFERALAAVSESADIASLKEGVELIYNKFVKYLERNGVKAIESTDSDFNTEFHEAVTTFPTDDESKKGKVIDTVQKGYTMNDKVIRHSKVVVGQ